MAIGGKNAGAHSKMSSKLIGMLHVANNVANKKATNSSGNQIAAAAIQNHLYMHTHIQMNMHAEYGRVACRFRFDFDAHHWRWT